MAKRKATRNSPIKKKKTATKRKMVKRKTASKRKTSPKKAKAKNISNTHSHWEAYRNLQKKVDKAWAKLKADVKRKAKPQILLHDKSQLLLLLGECNYMARECMRIASRSKKGR